MRWKKVAVVGTMVAAGGLLAPGSVPVQAQTSEHPASGSWEGAAQTPAGALGLALELEFEDDVWGGTFAIPAEGVELPLSGIRTPGDSLILPLAPGRILRGIVTPDSITGELEVQDHVMPVTMGRAGTTVAQRLAAAADSAAEAARPAPLEATGGGAAHAAVDPQALDSLLAAANAAHSHSVVVLRDSILVGAWHAGGERRLVETMSVTKSILNLAIGRLVTIGAIESIDDPVHAYFPEWNDGQKAEITIRHLLNHTSGIESPMPTAPIYESDDFVQFALDADQVAPPGNQLEYNNNATNLLAGLAGRAAGERLDRFLADDLFAKLGIREFRWSLDPAGNPHGMSGLQLYAEDLAKFGRLVLQRGEWRGEQLIDEAWFEESLRPGSELSEGAGLLWWLIRGDGEDGEEGAEGSENGEVIGYRADGYLGQYLVIYPEQGLVAVRLVSQTPAYDPESDGLREFQELVRALVPTGSSGAVGSSAPARVEGSPGSDE